MLIASCCVSTWGMKGWWNMPKLKQNQRTANLGMHAIKVSAVTSLSWQIDQPFGLQKQKHEISEPGEASVPIEPQEIKDSDSARSIISQLSEDNEVEHADLNGLKKWLAKGKHQLAKFFTTWTFSDSSKSDSKVQGSYKTKGPVQSLHAQQHHAKLSWDWTLKMWNEDYSDLINLFFQHRSLERKQASNPSPKHPQ